MRAGGGIYWQGGLQSGWRGDEVFEQGERERTEIAFNHDFKKAKTTCKINAISFIDAVEILVTIGL